MGACKGKEAVFTGEKENADRKRPKRGCPGLKGRKAERLVPCLCQALQSAQLTDTRDGSGAAGLCACACACEPTETRRLDLILSFFPGEDTDVLRIPLRPPPPYKPSPDFSLCICVPLAETCTKRMKEERVILGRAGCEPSWAGSRPPCAPAQGAQPPATL